MQDKIRWLHANIDKGIMHDWEKRNISTLQAVTEWNSIHGSDLSTREFKEMCKGFGFLRNEVDEHAYKEGQG